MSLFFRIFLTALLLFNGGTHGRQIILLTPTATPTAFAEMAAWQEEGMPAATTAVGPMFTRSAYLPTHVDTYEDADIAQAQQENEDSEHNLKKQGKSLFTNGYPHFGYGCPKAMQSRIYGSLQHFPDARRYAPACRRNVLLCVFRV